MPDTIYVTVTEQDIANGLAYSEEQCAVALALRRRFNLPVVVGLGCTTVGDTEYRHSNPLTTFIARFDLGKPVSPGRFRLTKVREADDAGSY